MEKNNRVQVPLSPKTRKAFQAMADASSCSLAAVCRDILEECAPVALEMSKALQKARKAPAQGMKIGLKALEAAMKDGDQIMLDLGNAGRPKKKEVNRGSLPPSPASIRGET